MRHAFSFADVVAGLLTHCSGASFTMLAWIRCKGHAMQGLLPRSWSRSMRRRTIGSPSNWALPWSWWVLRSNRLTLWWASTVTHGSGRWVGRHVSRMCLGGEQGSASIASRQYTSAVLGGRRRHRRRPLPYAMRLGRARC